MMFLFALLAMFLMSPTFLNFWISLLGSTLYVTVKIMHECKISAIKYFMFQELATWMSLMSIILGFLPGVMIMMLFKMGLPPLHSWVVPMVKKLNSSIKWLMVGSKIVPSITSLCLHINWFVPVMMLMSSIMFFPTTYSMKEIFIMSSGYNISWGFLTHSEMFTFSMLFIMSYLIYIQVFIEFHSKNQPDNMLEYMIVMGLPPSGFFFMKLFMVSMFSQQMVLLMLLMLSLFFLLVNYVKLIEKLSYKQMSAVKHNMTDKGYWFSMYSLVIMIIMMF